jgi:hypothetical protein
VVGMVPAEEDAAAFQWEGGLGMQSDGVHRRGGEGESVVHRPTQRV